MSDRGLILIDGIAPGNAETRTAAVFPDLNSRYPSFTFPHGCGLALIAVGGCIPGKLAALLRSAPDDPMRDQMREFYTRLGDGLRCIPLRDELDHFKRAWNRGQEASKTKLEEAAAAVQAKRSQAEDARRLAELKRLELETAHEQLRGQVQKTHALKTDLAKSESRRSELERQSSELEKRWSDLERSLGWLLLQKARRVRTSVFREGTLPGRSWSLLSRFIKTARRSGIRAAIGKTLEKIDRKLGRRLSSSDARASRLPSPISSQHVAHERFRELPWKYTAPPRTAGGQRGHQKILLVSHSACRTGAPLLLFGLTARLALRPDVECWIVLKQGGDLAREFAEIAPVLELDDLVAQGISREESLG